MPELPQLLSSAYQAYSRGDLGAAERSLDAVLQISTNNVEANVLLGIVCARKGDRQKAILLLRNAVKVDPRSGEAHAALSTLLFADRTPDEAISHGEAAIALHPSDPDLYRHLARDLIGHGKTEQAIPYLDQAMGIAPSNPALIQDLASALTEIGRLHEALALWKKLTRFHPALLIGWLKLGGMYLAARQFMDAAECGERALALDPNSADVRILIGLALLAGGEGKAAEAQLSEAIRLKPNEMVAYSAYGLALHERGQFEGARPFFERTIELRPSNGQAYYSLMRTRKTTEADRPLLEKLESHLENPEASVLDRSYMHYALGKAAEDLGEYEASMRHYDRATGLASEAWFTNRPPDRVRYSEVIQATIETFTPSMLSPGQRQTANSEKPLLVVGMIRSGTTLVEQILTSHPEVKGAGELTYWHEQAGKIFDVERKRVDESGLRKLADGYIELLDRLGPDHRRVTDKLPHNFAMLGFVLAAIPNARVIYVKRNAIDNCLSIFTTAYQHPPAFTLSRESIVFGYREHERIMAHWKSVFPNHQLLEVEYEEIVENREEVTRRMIDFVGLEWDDACLHHERNERNVNTPSVWQVRQPIYQTSVERWRKFEPWLGEFKGLT